MATKSSKISTKTLGILLVIIIASFCGALFYVSTQVNFRDTELVACHKVIDQQYATMTNLSTQINSLNNQVSDLNNQIAGLKGQMLPNLVTALGVSEILSNSTYNTNNPTTFNHLYISGTVTNKGLSTAYNAGLHVVAYDVTGNLVVNITVPITYGSYSNGVISNNALTLGSLAPLQIVSLESNAGISIVHEGVAATWTITPVCTNSP